MSNAGRPQAEINWDKVKGLLEAGCSGREIAGNIGVSAQTLYDRCVTDNGIEFSQYSQQNHAKGESRLLAHQYAKALGLTNEGDNTLLIWLGKVRLKQKENSESDKDKAPKQNEIDQQHNNMLKDNRIAELEKELDAYKSKAKSELCRSDAPL